MAAIVAERAAGRWRLPVALGVLAAAFGADLLTKAWAERSLASGDAVPLLGEVVRLRLGYNSGIAFGLFAQGGRLWLVLSGLLIAALTVWVVARLRAAAPSPATWAAALILAGALANFVDRWPDGRVTDVLDVGLGATRWPTFNLADVAITAGAAVLLATAVLGSDDPNPREMTR